MASKHAHKREARPPRVEEELHVMCVCACHVCVRARVRACHVCVCVVSVIVKRPVLPPSVVDGRSRNPLYYYY